MELIVRGSEYQDFLNCRKKWYYGWVEKLTPVRPDNKLFFGVMFHKWLEVFYKNNCNELQADLETSVWLNEQDTSGMEQVGYDDMQELFKGVRQNYLTKYHESDKRLKVLGTEVEFIVKLEDDMFMTGTIDLVYEIDGKIRFMDHKTVSSIQMYIEKAQMDRQISRYWWALKMIAAGVGRVRDKENDLWVRWNELEGKEIDGFDYNLIGKDFPKEPKVLKSGKLSTDKAQRTTYNKYLAKIAELNLDIRDYTEMLDMLQAKPDTFLQRIDVLRTQSELEAAAWEFSYTAGDIHDVKLMITENPEAIEPMTYRNIGTQCTNMCQFKSLCLTTINGGNISLTKNLGYKRNEDR